MQGQQRIMAMLVGYHHEVAGVGVSQVQHMTERQIHSSELLEIEVLEET
jgi:hypothetical protein